MKFKTTYKILLTIAGALMLAAGTAVFFGFNIFEPVDKSIVLLTGQAFLFAALFINWKFLRNDKQGELKKRESHESKI